MLLGIPSFWKAQHKDWKVTVLRTSIERLGYHVISPYLSLYIIALGATKSQLGTITALGLLMSGLQGPFVGRFIDKNGAKNIYVLGICLICCSYLLYGLAPGWQLCVLAMLIYYLGQGVSMQSCGTICGNCLKTCDRARGMLVCESLTAGVLGMVGPMIAVFLLTKVIGTETDTAAPSDLRWLFFVSSAFTVASLVFVCLKLGNQRWAAKNTNKGALRQGLDILRTNINARKWIVISALSNMPTAMVIPYFQVFAEEMKGASLEVLGFMVTASALTSTLFGYPAGALADKLGRKKVLFVIIPLFWLSNIMLILSPSPFTLVIAGTLQGFYYISSPLTGAIQRELVSQEVMGIWLGTTKFTNAIFSALLAFSAGLIYDHIGPQWCFIIYIAIDACVRMPLLASLPETLKESAA